MKQNTIWTKSKARLCKVHQNNYANYNWVFLPGGPGLGSESLASLTSLLPLPGSIWHLDLPGDGSNTTLDDVHSFANWSKSLIEACSAMEKVILVAHSSGGMFALATPELEANLSGLVLMDSAPNADWQNHFMQYINSNPIPELQRLQKIYDENPSNDLFKELTLASAPSFSIPENLDKITELLSSLPFSYTTHRWTAHNFHRTYQAKWVPQQIPTLIFSGAHDHLTPLTLFSEAKQFQRQNIYIREIENASHFPWIDNPEQVKQVFAEYCLFKKSFEHFMS